MTVQFDRRRSLLKAIGLLLAAVPFTMAQAPPAHQVAPGCGFCWAICQRATAIQS